MGGLRWLVGLVGGGWRVGLSWVGGIGWVELVGLGRSDVGGWVGGWVEKNLPVPQPPKSKTMLRFRSAKHKPELSSQVHHMIGLGFFATPQKQNPA